jgi:hypothetical protein
VFRPAAGVGAQDLQHVVVRRGVVQDTKCWTTRGCRAPVFRNYLRALRAFLRPFAFDDGVAPAIRKSSSFFPALIAAANRGDVMSRNSPFSIKLTRRERAELIRRAGKYRSAYRDVIRAKIVLLASEGLANDAIGARLDTPRQIVSKWRLVSRVTPVHTALRNCTRDEGRSFEFGKGKPSQLGARS